MDMNFHSNSEDEEDLQQDSLTPSDDILEPDSSSSDSDDAIMTKPDYSAEILKILQSNASPSVLREELEDYHENDIAEVLDQLTVTERKRLYRILDASMLSEIFEYVDDVSSYLDEMNIRKAVEIVSEMDADTAVSVLRSLSKEKRSLMVELLDEDAQKDIALIASFDEDEIGSRMSTNFILVRENLTVKQAMRSLVEQAAENDNISTIFVETENHTYYGAIDLKDLITAREGTSLNDLVMTSFPYLYGQESIDDCIEKLKDYSEDSIPILNNANKILGVITSQNIIEVVDDQMGEDYAKLAGLTSEEDLNEPIHKSVTKRFPWLVILLGLGLIVSTVVGFFEQVVAQLTIIMTFQSMVLGMAGNVGTQSLGVTIRVLMDESLTLKQKLQLVTKEARVGFCNGLILGLISFVVIGLYLMTLKGKAPMFAFAVSGCIGLALLTAMLISSLSGTLVPLFFKKINIDPAVASGPLITTINDLVAVVSYYGLSWLLLLNVLHLG